MKRYSQSSKIEKIEYVILFLFMLHCNFLTLRFVDDYQYVFSFATHDRIDSLEDIFCSLAAHTRVMNGRLVAHFFVHLFCMLPMWVFDVVNSAVFVIMIAYISKISRGKNERNNIMPVVIFCSLWLYEPVFGQVNFWIAGSCNYLWSAVFGFSFIVPFVNEYAFDKGIDSKMAKVAFALFSGAAGAYSESGSAAFVFMALLLLMLIYLEKKRIPVYLWFALGIAFLGYISIYLAPAQWKNKASAFSFADMYANIIRSTTMYQSFGELAVAFVVMLVFSVRNHIEGKRVKLALVLVAGSLCANYILVFANWYHERSAMSACVLLIVADAILLQELLNNEKCKSAALSLIATILLLMPNPFMEGFIDIYYTNLSMQNNEVYIYECIDAGEMDLAVPTITASTKYTPLYGLRYLSTEDTTTWPNGSMAWYYGVNSMIGIEMP